jgi:hypothetical protein
MDINGYSQHFTGLLLNSKGSSHLDKQKRPLGSVDFAYVKGISEKLKCYRIFTILGESSKLNTLGLLWEPDWKEICKRRHTALIAFPANETEAPLAKTDC